MKRVDIPKFLQKGAFDRQESGWPVHRLFTANRHTRQFLRHLPSHLPPLHPSHIGLFDQLLAKIRHCTLTPLLGQGY